MDNLCVKPGQNNVNNACMHIKVYCTINKVYAYYTTWMPFGVLCVICVILRNLRNIRNCCVVVQEYG